MAVELVEGLGPRGTDVYNALVVNRDLSAAHKTMALNAARMADMLDKIEMELALSSELTVVNSQGTTTVNPLISEARMITGALSQILVKMGVAELPEAKSTEKSRTDELADKRAKRRAAIRRADPEDSIQPAGTD